MINKYLLTLFATLLLINNSLVAQLTDSIKTEFYPKMQYLLNKNNKTKLGFYIQQEGQLTQIASEIDYLHGYSSMLIFNRKFAIGGYRTITRQSNFSPKDYPQLYLRLRNQGLKLEYSFNPHRAFHLTVPINLGVTIATFDSSHFRVLRDYHNNVFYRYHNNDSLKAQFTTLQTGINLEGNLIKFVKFYFGASYRFGILHDKEVLIDKNLINGFSFNFGIKIGIFAFSKSEFKNVFKSDKNL